MLTWEEDVEAAALQKRGWSISAIARHLGRDRKTVRAYLTGTRTRGRRKPARPDPLAPSYPISPRACRKTRTSGPPPFTMRPSSSGSPAAMRPSPASCAAFACGHTVKRVPG